VRTPYFLKRLSKKQILKRKIAIRTNDYKYIVAKSKREAVCRCCGYIHGGLRELYDLSVDPNELRNIVEERADVADDLH
jgi:hypothetical protein